MADQYFYRNPSGQESGPYDIEECRRMISTGLMDMGGTVRASDSQTWQSVTQVFGVQPPQEPTPPVAGPAAVSPPPGTPQALAPKCTRTAYILLALLPGIFVGIYGIHNLVAGYTQRGIIQLVLSAVFWITVWFCVGALVYFGLLIWAIVECFQVKVDANNVPMPS
jgi:TM2 domain-containing membrane protein YozV